MTRDRICCDGLCSQGRACPLTANTRRPACQQRLAPGVVQGPYRSPTRLAALWLALVERALAPRPFWRLW